MTAITLLLCTRNRSDRLGATLHSITRAAHTAPDIAIAVVIVDNGSTDDTADHLHHWRSDQKFPVTLLFEPRPGLARARNAGLAKIASPIVAMTDDDCILHPDFLPAMARSFAAHTGPRIIGGRILLGDPADLPVTIKLEDHPMRACPDIFPGGFVMGANMAFTSDVIACIGLFDDRFGAGARFGAAEDTDFLFRALGAGIPVHYDPHIVVDHHHGRRDPADLIRLLAGYAYGDGALYAKHLFRDRRILAAIREDIRDLGRDVADPRPFADIPRFYRFRLRHKLAGFLAYLLGIRRRS